MELKFTGRPSWIWRSTSRGHRIAGVGAWSGRLLRDLSRETSTVAGWLASDVRDVVTLRRRARASSSTEEQEESQDFTAPLRGFRRAAALARLVAVARRWIIVGAILAIALALVRWQIAPLTLWAVLAPALALAALGTIVTAFRSPEPSAVAKLLDRRLALKEQVSSALEARPQAGNPLAARLQWRAGTLATRARGEWRVRPIVSPLEWVALAGAAIVLVLLLTFSRPASHAAHRAAARPVHVVAVTRVGGIRTTVVSIGPISSSTQPGRSRSIARQLGIQSRSTGNNGQQQSRPTSHNKKNGTVIPPGRASEAAFPTRKQTSLGAASGSHANGSQSAANLVTSRRGVTSPPPRGGSGKSASSKNTVSIKGPRLANTNGGTNNRAASGKASKSAGGVAGRGAIAQRNPYGVVPTNLRKLPKPGLITGPALNSHGNTNGSNLAGRGRGANGRASSRHLAGTRGRQLSLTSSYGSSAGSTQKQSSLTAPAGQHRTAHVRGGRAGTGQSDYIPPDANSVGRDDSGLVVRYFAPAGKQ